MKLSFILLAYKNAWSTPKSYGDNPDPYITLIFLLCLIVPILFLILMGTVNWVDVKLDIKNYFFKKIIGKIELKSSNIPLGLKYILLNMGIKSRNIKSVYKINRKFLKKMDTYFSYEVVTKKEKFHIYFDEINGDKSWFIYKKGQFDNKPIRIKNNYYDIIEVINNNLYTNIKNNFHKRFKEQSFSKV